MGTFLIEYFPLILLVFSLGIMLNLLKGTEEGKKANSKTYVIIIIGKNFFFFLPNSILVLEAELTILECLVQTSNSCDILYLQLGQNQDGDLSPELYRP